MKLAEIRPEVYGFEDRRVEYWLQVMLNGLGQIVTDEVAKLDVGYSEVLWMTFYRSDVVFTEEQLGRPATKQTRIGRAHGVIPFDIAGLTDPEMLECLTISMSVSISRFLKHCYQIDFDAGLLADKIRSKEHFYTYACPVDTRDSKGKEEVSILEKRLFSRAVYRFVQKSEGMELFVDSGEMPMVYGPDLLDERGVLVLSRIKYLKTRTWLNQNQLHISYGDADFIYDISRNTFEPMTP